MKRMTAWNGSANANDNFLKATFKSIRHKYRSFRRRKHFQLEYNDRYEFFRRTLVMLDFNKIPGDYAEFGCWSGDTFSMVHRLMTGYPKNLGNFHLWAYDSFKGLPPSTPYDDAHPVWVEGRFAMSESEFVDICRQRGIGSSDYTIISGYYNESLKNPQSKSPEKIRLAYIDCDLYSSTFDVLTYLMPRLQHGMVIAFDDYYCFSSDAISGERLAMLEHFNNQSQWRLVPYQCISWGGMSFIVEDVSLSRSTKNSNQAHL